MIAEMTKIKLVKMPNNFGTEVYVRMKTRDLCCDKSDVLIEMAKKKLFSSVLVTHSGNKTELRSYSKSKWNSVQRVAVIVANRYIVIHEGEGYQRKCTGIFKVVSN